MEQHLVEFRNVSLDFRLAKEGHVTSIKEWAIRRLTKQLTYRQIRALSDVSFTVEAHQTLGVIGHNGAGKSTLLRIAAGILQPSKGVATMRGAMAPIIELGTGFEAELSGRENIFFNGALLGRSWTDMQARVDDIVEFSELEEFIDNPIRTYSTGMVARLAFAIATTVDAKILLLDEVLAVGDQQFQKKCDERMTEFRKRGVTTVLVSHSLETILRMCNQVLWLDHGRVKGIGPAAEIVAEYQTWVAAQ